MSLRVERLRPSAPVSTWISGFEKTFVYENLTFTKFGTTNTTIGGNGTSTVSVFKTAGSATWDTKAYVNQAFTAPVTVEFNKMASAGDDGNSYAMIGWNTDPTGNSSYTSIDYASYPYRTDTYSVYHNGTQVLFSGAWDSGRKFYLVYGVDGFIRHYNGPTQLYSINYGTGQSVYLDSAYYSVNATNAGFSNIRVTKNIWNGTAYV